MVIRARQGEHSAQASFLDMIYEDLILADHLLCKLAAAVDFSFVCDLVSDRQLPIKILFPLGCHGPSEF